MIHEQEQLLRENNSELEKKLAVKTRELEIQSSLEKVREATTKMQRSEDLKEVNLVMLQQMQNRGIAAAVCFIIIMNEAEGSLQFNLANSKTQSISLFKGKISDISVNQKMYDNWKLKSESFVIDMQGEELRNYRDYLKDLGVQIHSDSPANQRAFSMANFSKGIMGVASNEPLSSETINVMKRFAHVFDGTYTRFLDLQKAEAQVREAQIQLALERVRAKTMAMQKPSEFVDVINAIGEQFTHLDFDFDWVNFSANGLDVSKAIDIWNFVVVPGVYQGATRLVIPFFEHPVFTKAVESVNEYNTSGNDFSVVLLNKKDKDSFLDHLFTNTIYKDLPDEAKMSQYNREVYFTSNIVLKDTWLSIGKYDAKPLTDEQIAILKRLANAFGQAHTRFIDLQKAEEQARTAQIEAALERVRSKTMAMHKSSDLLDVIKTLGDQFQLLGFKIHSANFNTSYRQKDWNLWLYNPGNPVYPEQVHIPYLDNPFFNRTLESIESGSDFNAFVFTKEEKDGFLDHLYANTIARNSSEERKKFTYDAPGFAWSTVYLKNTALTIANYDAEPYTEEQNAIIRRFGNAFEQTYTRFLDLQKAEAQARESTIEAGMERVRSRAMAMQSSEELAPLIGTVFTELTRLDLALTRCVIWIFDPETNGATWWMANSEDAQNPINCDLPYNANEPHLVFLEQWQKRAVKFQYELSGTIKKDWDNYLFNKTGLARLPAVVIEGMKAPDRVFLTASFNNFGAMNAATLEPLSDEHVDILLRFAKVFDLTYTRFNDLKQAEAQARESQIQLALERVRARTMAMQKSTELKEVIQLVYEQFVHLNIHIEHTGFLIDYKTTDDMHIWLADQHLVPSEVTIPYFDSIPNNSIKEAKEKGQDFFRYHLTFEEKNKFYGDLFKFIPGVPQETVEYYLNCAALAGSGVLLENIGLYIENFSGTPYSDEENTVLMRFGKVFQQTYTRFIDLQKAEAQAREAQIELGLERVRARAMAMHNSVELKEVVKTLFEELTHLDVNLQACLIATFDAATFDQKSWMIHLKTNEPYTFLIPHNEQPFYVEMLKAWKERNANWAYVLEGETKIKWEDFLFTDTDFRLLPQLVKEEMQKPEKVFFAASYYAYGAIQSSSPSPFSKQSIDILQRFSKVFDSCYTRFLDLQKAEVQAREAQIELGLERVRARAMAMQKSDELKELIGTVFTELTKLDLVLTRCVIMIYDIKTLGITWWMANSEDPSNPMGLFVKYHQLPPHLAYIKAWKERHLKWQYILEGKIKKEWDDFLFVETELSHLPDFVIAGMKAPDRVYLNASFNSFGNLTLATLEPLSNEHADILLRFAKVFDLTYTRFNDLQKAEAQAREATIEAALERVRAKAMAMHNSNDVSAAASMVFTELRKLGIHPIRCGVGLLNKESHKAQLYSATSSSDGDSLSLVGWVMLSGHPVLENIYDTWMRNEDYFPELTGPELKSYYENLLAGLSLPTIPNWETGEKQYGHFFSFSVGCLYVWSDRHYNDSEIKILQRFATIIDLTFRRYLDLQKAEAQARESQIQLALERVRARTMAMQHSNELSETTAILFRQMNELGNTPERLNIGIIKEDKGFVETWATEQGCHQINHSFNARLDETTTMAKLYEGWKTKRTSMVVDISGNELKQWIRFLQDELKMPVKEELLQNRRVQTVAYFKEGFILLTTPEPLPAENISLLERFAEVFNLTYTRFLDLQKAEAQVREAQIEAALERVRGKAMSMHSSRDLADTIEVFYHEMELLSVTPRRCGVGLMDKETHVVELSTMNTTEQGESIEVIGKLKLVGHPVLEGIYDNWILQKEYHPVLRGNEIKKYYQLIRPQISYPDYPTDTAQYGYFFFFKEGGVYAWTEKELSEDELKIYRRFTSVLSLTYKRYKDLKDAEANAREAIKRASLDRVRAETASMRTTGDLEKITPLIWNELTTLRVPFIRCGVFIMDEQQEVIHSFLSTPEGKAIAAFQLPYDSAGELSKVLVNWHKNEIFKDHWDEAEFAAWTKSLVERGAIASEDKYSTAHRPVNLDLHFLPFLQGMLYVGSEAPLNQEEINLVQSLAGAFSTAYARYEDFNKLESAKVQIEKTLVELKQAQAQLVQSEKMASLGELTAGIAHEIQNPLNFVNNFSDVNQELLVEMKDEMKKGNIEEADSIANDVIENEQKINHHGKRADAIVKGMLQHSRKTSGQKEPTDINALADEYLRLSYHGLRAKDKTFNAEMKTDFDGTIAKINVIPQDIGRVLLNLFNNAFYAVQQKQKELAAKEVTPFEKVSPLYRPTVSVTTMKCDDKVQIVVKDNGNGIPQNIVDKIFQPFFTTKPAGQGTGLGLSLAYDIIKAHGGTLKVESEEGEGSEFIIKFPVT